MYTNICLKNGFILIFKIKTSRKVTYIILLEMTSYLYDGIT